jgi:hypothetical protein
MPARRSIVFYPRHLMMAGFAALLGAVVVWRLAVPAAFPDVPVAAAAEPDATLGPASKIKLPPLSDLSVAAERPLFNPNRRRAVEVPAAVQQQAVQAKSFRAPVLLGIASIGDRRVALIRAPEEKDARRIHIGDSIEGWILESIGRDAVTFRNGSAEHEIRLRPVNTPGGRAMAIR